MHMRRFIKSISMPIVQNNSETTIREDNISEDGNIGWDKDTVIASKISDSDTLVAIKGNDIACTSCCPSDCVARCAIPIQTCTLDIYTYCIAKGLPSCDVGTNEIPLDQLLRSVNMNPRMIARNKVTGSRACPGYRPCYAPNDVALSVDAYTKTAGVA